VTIELTQGEIISIALAVIGIVVGIIGCLQLKAVNRIKNTATSSGSGQIQQGQTINNIIENKVDEELKKAVAELRQEAGKLKAEVALQREDLDAQRPYFEGNTIVFGRREKP